MKLDLGQFEGVAFDFDGTLAQSHEAHMQAREYAFAAHNVQATPEQMAIGHRHGNNPTTIIAGILKAAGHVPVEADPYTHELIGKIVVTKNRHYAALTKEGLDLQPGVLMLLQRAVEYYGADKIAVVTTAPLLDVTPTLERNDIARYFSPERIMTRDTAEKEGLVMKPAPDQYVYAAKTLGIAAAKMLVVEDTTGGVVAGQEAGASVLAVGTTSPREIFFTPDNPHHPDYFAESFLDIEISQAL